MENSQSLKTVLKNRLHSPYLPTHKQNMPKINMFIQCWLLPTNVYTFFDA